MNRKQMRSLLSALFSLMLCACEAGLPTLAETGAGAGASKKGSGGIFAWAAPGPSEQVDKAETKAERGAAQSSKTQARQPDEAPVASRAMTTGKVTKKSGARPGRIRANRGR